MKKAITNCRIVSPGVDIPRGAIGIEDGSIFYVGEDTPEADEVIDASGQIAVPGFIDIHTHGANGGDFATGGIEGLRTFAEAKLREGVTTFFPTTLTLPHDGLVPMFEAMAEYQRNPSGAKAPLVHVEGPFINPNCAGAQNPAFVRTPDAAEIDQLNAIAPVGIVSLAVEMEGGVDFAAAMKERGITTSAAHTAATYAQFLEAKAAGLGHLTHFCNQMTPLHHREIGLVGAGLRDRDIMVEMILDGIHLCPDMIALAFGIIPVEQIMLITDSVAASWLPNGTELDLGGLEVIVQDDACRLKSNGALAGSTLRYNRALKFAHEVTGLPLADLIRTTSWNQAQSLGLEGLGKIETGFVGDVVLLDEELEVVQVIAN